MISTSKNSSVKLAFAITTALTLSNVVFADTTLYGKAAISVDYVDQDNINDGEGYFDLQNNSSRLGVQGSEDLGNGLKAIYQFEFGVDPTGGDQRGGTYFNDNRPRYVGLQGDFGTITMGTQDTPYFTLFGIGDIFNTFWSFGGEAYMGPARLGKVLAYTSPEFSGLSAAVALIVDGANNENRGFEDTIDIWNPALLYQNGPLFAGITYVRQEGDKDVNILSEKDLWGAAVGYSADPFSLSFSFETGDWTSVIANEIGEAVDVNNYYLTASYTFGNNTVRGAVGYVDVDGYDDVTNWLVGLEHALSNRTALWVEYVGRDNDDPDNSDKGIFGDGAVVSVGMRHDF